jgi:glutamine amidotransferase
MIAIIDYGLGNIKAFSNVYKRLNIPHCLANTPDKLAQANKIILPGVGAFDYAMTLLNNSGMREILDSLVLDKGVPVLGICVGMQMLADSSEEGELEGLGWIPAKVKKFPDSDRELLAKYPLPHMGWNSVEIDKEDSLFVGFGTNARFYFLHSYYFECQNADSSLASAEYGVKFSAIVKHDNIYGVQCHPEKSHANGIMLLENFSRV